MMLLKEYLQEVQFRDDILRGVRLFLIAFAAILIGVWAYRMLRIPSDVQGAAQQELPTAPETAQPAEDASPEATAVATSSEPHGLVVPPPPPVGGTHVSKAARPAKVAMPEAATPPVVARERRPVAPSGREFETAEPGALPAGPAEDSGDANPSSPKKGVGYKSLLEADPNRALIEPSLLGSEQPVEKQKGNRFLRAVGKIFHPGAKKETVPLTLEPQKQ
jgi:hypothetical protein